jgi:hypothetical protein
MDGTIARYLIGKYVRTGAAFNSVIEGMAATAAAHRILE